MAAPYPLYYVYNMKIKPGKRAVAAKWWRERGEPFFGSLPWIKSIRVYAPQFGLGGEYDLEFWLEIEDYAAFDKWDADSMQNMEHWEISKEENEVFYFGPARLMGEWPESALTEE